MRAIFQLVRGTVATLLLAAFSSGQNVAIMPADQSAKGLHFATVSAQISQMVLDAAPKSVSGPGVESPLIDLSQPVAHYTVRDMVRLLDKGNLDEAAELFSYDYFNKRSMQPIQFVSIRVDPTGKPVGPASVVDHPLRTTISDGLDQVAKLLQVKMGSYEVRCLDYNMLTLDMHVSGRSVVWLKSAPGGTDLIYFVMDYPGENKEIDVQKGALYTWPIFLEHLQAAYQREKSEAAAQRAANSRVDGNGGGG